MVEAVGAGGGSMTKRKRDRATVVNDTIPCPPPVVVERTGEGAGLDADEPGASSCVRMAVHEEVEGRERRDTLVTDLAAS
jgi:hypothetical protein